MSNTDHFHIPLPDENSTISDEMYRLRAAFEIVDSALSVISNAVAGKAATDHKHEMSDVDGLVDALAAKMAADKKFSIAELVDVIGASEAGTGYVLAKDANEKFSFLSAANALGNHNHPMSQIQGLDAALATLALKTDFEAVKNAVNHATSGLATKLPISGGTLTGALNLLEADIWRYRVGIGESYIVDTSIAGVDIPPSTTTGPVFIQLTAGLTGTGKYNAGKLTTETVTGSAPNTLATAVINLTGSPINGKTIRLINTEGRILRPYLTPGTILGDAIRNITGNAAFRSRNGTSNESVISASGAFEKTLGTSAASTQSSPDGIAREIVTFDASLVVPTANENRMKMLGVTAYMRIK